MVKILQVIFLSLLNILFLSYTSVKLILLKMKEWKKISHANTNPKKVRVTILMSDRVDFQTRHIVRNKKAHFIILKGFIHQEDILRFT